MSKEKTKPEWAEDLENIGKKFDDSKKQKWERKGDFAWGIVGTIICFLIINNAPNFFPGLFTSSYPAVLAVMNTVLAFQAFGFALLAFFSPKWFYFIVQALMNGLSVISLLTIITLFPFNLFSPLDVIFKFGLVVALVVTAVTVFFQLMRGLFSILRWEY